MSARIEVLLWATRVLARKTSAPHLLLEIAEQASLEDATAAFHRIARMAHPDLHRTVLEPAELDQITMAYARVAAAYQDFRSRWAQTAKLRTVSETGPGPGPRPRSATQDVAGEPAAPAPAAAAAASAMSSKALIYYRKAELCLRRGDLRGAVLQLKLAIAADPSSSLLRSALAEVEAAVGK